MRKLPVLPLLVLGTVVAAQSPAQRPAFEVAAVKRNTSAARLMSTPRFVSHQVVATNVPLLLLLTASYGVRLDEVVDAPDWSETERFDINARAADNSTPAQRQIMLQRLLEERFALRVHRDRRDVPALALSLLDTRGSLGPNLRVSSANCDQIACSGRAAPGNVAAVGAPWSAVVGYIKAAVDGRLVDRTGLSGRFDITLAYSRSPATSQDEVDIFDAVRQQLGLTLERTTAPADVLVVDHVERPTN